MARGYSVADMRLPFRFRPSLSFVLLCLLIAILWLAGGASRPDVAGQPVVRLAAAIALATAAILGPRPSFGSNRAIAYLLAACLALPLLQIIPLPPAIWEKLPGRAPLLQAALLDGEPQPWRPWAIVPGAAANAAASLVVPLAVLVLVCGLRRPERAWLPGLTLALIAASALIGQLQFAGAGLADPLINYTGGTVSGTFANRNHFALFLAIGCALAPVWAFQEGAKPGWRAPAAIGLLLVFIPTILASGSRVGILVGVLGLAAGPLMVHHRIRRLLGKYPAWALPAAASGALVLVATVVLLAVAADRALSIRRILTDDPEQDLRLRALPTIWGMVRGYFPVGSGLGGFDPVFRMHEPLALLNPTYLNHAHNDWLEVVLDSGLPGFLLIVGALLWWAVASMRAWRPRSGSGNAVAKAGSLVLLLIMIASIFDYPARTPLMMAVIVIAAVWLGETQQDPGSALLASDQHI